MSIRKNLIDKGDRLTNNISFPGTSKATEHIPVGLSCATANYLYYIFLKNGVDKCYMLTVTQRPLVQHWLVNDEYNMSSRRVAFPLVIISSCNVTHPFHLSFTS